MAHGETHDGVTLPDTRAFTLLAPESGRDYRIEVALPEAPPPAEGYPVLYLLDGNARLPLVQAARDTLSPPGPENSQLLIVAIGYPGVARFDFERRAEDYTPPQGGPEDIEGPADGADAFLAFIETRLKPEIAARFPVDRDREALFGHSYGGLFALHALMTRPASFERFIAISPSLWWYGNRPLDTLAAQLPPAGANDVAPRVLIGVGGLEQTPREAMRGTPRAKRMRDRAMVDNARRFADWLAERHDGWRVRFMNFPGEHHGSVMWPATRAALTFLKEP
ncbi:alpha/beta hydrolase [Halomonas sp. THAF12]|uniref:alpha/beta hydrolase n=1 Tax=Halomonas sp. B23F22_10 TaxID=3459515 RepID=UPI00373F15B6